MTATEASHLQGLLETKRVELEGLIRNREAIAVDAVADVLDQIQHASEREMAMRHLERDSIHLSEVRAALDRIRLGTFGICQECEDLISVKRLTALPWTALCLVCREAAERNRTSPDALTAE